MALTDKLTAIANAIRAKTGKGGELTLDAMPAEIASIGAGGQSINGSFRVGSSWFSEKSVTVSGLPFTPKWVMAYATVSYNNNFFEQGVNLLYIVELGNNGQHAIIAASDGAVYDDSLNDWFLITTKDNGFSIDIVEEEGIDAAPNYITGGEWRYIAGC